MSEKLLDKINYPVDLRKLEKSQLEKVSQETKKLNENDKNNLTPFFSNTSSTDLVIS